MTMTRAAVVLEGESPLVGFGYVAGRATRHAELAALFDALLQDDSRHADLFAAVIAPLKQDAVDAQAVRSAAVAATRVDFTTMVRGDG
jgi:alpha-D-ribose 1-methylphosphonate 5-triphosphate synthase subunit PhnG